MSSSKEPLSSVRVMWGRSGVGSILLGTEWEWLRGHMASSSAGCALESFLPGPESFHHLSRVPLVKCLNLPWSQFPEDMGTIVPTFTDVS